MWWEQPYYYSDSSFQLELNLQSMRRELIQMIEEFEAFDCTRCRYIKCRCEETSVDVAAPTPPRSLTSSEYDDVIKSPPASDLPRPEFKNSSEGTEPPMKDVESWVRTSTPNPDKTVSPGSKPNAIGYRNFWPPAPKSVWNDYKDKINKPEINTATVSQTGNVQEFFKSFNNMCCTGAYEKNRALMQKLKDLALKAPEYTYF